MIRHFTFILNILKRTNQAITVPSERRIINKTLTGAIVPVYGHTIANSVYGL